MSNSWFPFVLVAILMAMGILAMAFSVRQFVRRQSTPGPQKSRQVARIALGPMIIGIMIILYLGQTSHGLQAMFSLMCLPLVVVALRFAWLIFHEPTEADAIENFAHDREHCGKCGYSVTGNMTGTCPECAWVYPTGELPVEESD